MRYLERNTYAMNKLMSKNPDWMGMSEERVEELHQEKIDAAADSFYRKVCVSLFLLVVGAIFQACIYFDIVHKSPASPLIDIDIIFVGQFWVCFCMIMFYKIEMDREFILSPLAESEEEDACMEALNIIEISPSAKAWRDRLLARGRQLRVVDLTMMIKLRNQELTDNPDMNDKACAKLHDVAV